MLRGNRVVLRPFRASDLPRMRAWFRDPATARFWGRAPILDDQAFEDDLAGRFATFNRDGYFAIDDESGELVGRVEFEHFDPIDRSVEVMIMIGEASARGRGTGTDALATLLRHLFRDRQAERVWLTVLDWNHPAIRTYEKLGFVREGLLQADCWVDGSWHDQLVMGLLRTEFEAGPFSSAPAADR